MPHRPSLHSRVSGLPNRNAGQGSFGACGAPRLPPTMICPSCGHENPQGNKFCGECAAPLAPIPTAQGEERKVVTVLFCDLVGFTASSDQADPEDVRARIRPYHTRLRREIEAYGGTVEKFIGDAVMAVFGAPVAHEDDAERAVRAGLRILEAISDLNEEGADLDLQVRVGIETGEAVVALGARPEQGEGIVTGDVVNTASRLQGAAPPSCGPPTRRTDPCGRHWNPLGSPRGHCRGHRDAPGRDPRPAVVRCR